MGSESSKNMPEEEDNTNKIPPRQELQVVGYDRVASRPPTDSL